jgi:hypothetical protein
MPKTMISGHYRTFRDLNPGETYIEYEGSTITIPIRVKQGDRWLEERLKLRAFMRLEVFPPHLNGLGTREFQFIIRDWELFGFSPLLNKLFMGNERGYMDPSRRSARAEHAVMTFCVAHHYEKHGDDDNDNLTGTQEIRIDDITHHDHDGNNNLYWHIDSSPTRKDAFTVRFFRTPPSKKALTTMDDKDPEIAFSMVAKADDVTPGQAFRADIDDSQAARITTPERGNTVMSQYMKLRTPLSLSWRLGKNPRPGAHGRLHIVSPSRSLCLADQGPGPGEPRDSADFPARITYAINYNIYINNVHFVEDQAGIAIADGVVEIPPRDVLVAFEKPQAGAVLGNHLEFDVGTCTGMVPVLQSEYRGGVEMARYWRSCRLDVQSGQAPGLPPVMD